MSRYDQYNSANEQIRQAATSHSTGVLTAGALFALLNYVSTLEDRIDELEGKLETLIDVVDDLRG